MFNKFSILQDTHVALIEKQNSSIEFLTNSFKDLAIGLQTLDTKVEQCVLKQQSSVPENPLYHCNPTSMNASLSGIVDPRTPLNLMRLDVPRFAGENLLAWISRIQCYFDYYNTPAPQRLLIAGFYLDGDALDWFDWMNKNKLFSSWKEFLEIIEKRFGPSECEDYFGKLCQLVQQSSLADFQHQFEQLANQILGVLEHTLVSCFVSGLRCNLRKEVRVYCPQSLVQVMGLAQLFDDRSLDSKYTSNAWGGSAKSDKSLWQSRTSSLPLLLPTSAPVSSSSVVKSKPTVILKRLSPSEMAARREKGSCYNCGEKYAPGHKCKCRLYLFMVEEENSVQEESISVMETEEQITDVPEISLHAMAWQVSPRTLRIQSLIFGLQLQTLIDSGSTHNFIQERVAKFLDLPIHPSPHFSEVYSI